MNREITDRGKEDDSFPGVLSLSSPTTEYHDNFLIMGKVGMKVSTGSISIFSNGPAQIREINYCFNFQILLRSHVFNVI